MRILIACNVDSYPNPFVKILYNGLIKQGVDVTCSIDEFWSNSNSYDLVHIQWPNLLVEKTDVDCTRLRCVISNLKKQHIPLVCTCHNLVPHYNNEKALNNTYKIVYDNCDYIQHLGEKSIELLKELAKDTLVVVVSHNRDDANIYADRKIELFDGKIFSDVSKNIDNELPLIDGNVINMPFNRKLNQLILLKLMMINN